MEPNPSQRSPSLSAYQLSEVQTRSDAIFGNLPCPDSSAYLRLNQTSFAEIRSPSCGTTFRAKNSRQWFSMVFQLRNLKFNPIQSDSSSAHPRSHPISHGAMAPPMALPRSSSAQTDSKSPAPAKPSRSSPLPRPKAEGDGSWGF